MDSEWEVVKKPEKVKKQPIAGRGNYSYNNRNRNGGRGSHEGRYRSGGRGGRYGNQQRRENQQNQASRGSDSSDRVHKPDIVQSAPPAVSSNGITGDKGASSWASLLKGPAEPEKVDKEPKMAEDGVEVVENEVKNPWKTNTMPTLPTYVMGDPFSHAAMSQLLSGAILFDYPPHVLQSDQIRPAGLPNSQGRVCFANSVLQLLLNAPSLFPLNMQLADCWRAQRFPPSFPTILLDYASLAHVYIHELRIGEVLSPEFAWPLIAACSQHGGFEPEDAHEFFLSLLNTLVEVTDQYIAEHVSASETETETETETEGGLGLALAAEEGEWSTVTESGAISQERQRTVPTSMQSPNIFRDLFQGLLKVTLVRSKRDMCHSWDPFLTLNIPLTQDAPTLLSAMHKLWKADTIENENANANATGGNATGGSSLQRDSPLLHSTVPHNWPPILVLLLQWGYDYDYQQEIAPAHFSTRDITPSNSNHGGGGSGGGAQRSRHRHRPQQSHSSLEEGNEPSAEAMGVSYQLYGAIRYVPPRQVAHHSTIGHYLGGIVLPHASFICNDTHVEMDQTGEVFTMAQSASLLVYLRQ
jgi:hypothetical protein